MVTYTERDSLDEQACSQRAPMSVRSRYADMFEYWVDEYEKLLSRAGSEDFIGHVRQQYSGEVPIWIAVETFDFGGLARLYGLLERYDQNLIATRFGVSQGRMFHNWLVGIAVIRNHSARHNRLWNRQLPRALANIQPTTVTARLHHLDGVDQRRKLYVWAAVIAYAIRNYDNTSNWYGTFTTQMRKFPTDNDVNPNRDMGFPTDWKSNDLWQGAPASTRSLPV